MPMVLKPPPKPLLRWDILSFLNSGQERLLKTLVLMVPTYAFFKSTTITFVTLLCSLELGVYNRIRTCMVHSIMHPASPCSSMSFTLLKISPAPNFVHNPKHCSDVVFQDPLILHTQSFDIRYPGSGSGKWFLHVVLPCEHSQTVKQLVVFICLLLTSHMINFAILASKWALRRLDCPLFLPWKCLLFSATNHAFCQTCLLITFRIPCILSTVYTQTNDQD